MTTAAPHLRPLVGHKDSTPSGNTSWWIYAPTIGRMAQRGRLTRGASARCATATLGLVVLVAFWLLPVDQKDIMPSL
eukprot:scaffold104181_cov28-Tisochrysis_lutea.AAC.2